MSDEVPPSEDAIDAADTLRDDVTDAIEEAPPTVRSELGQNAVEALNFLNYYLPDDESVELVTSVAPGGGEGPRTAVLAITGRRLVLVAPGPQASAWPLATVTRVQQVLGVLTIVADRRITTLGLPPGPWASDVESRVKWAVAIAVLDGPDTSPS